MFGGNKEPFMSKNVIHSIGDLVFLVFNSVYSTLQNQKSKSFHNVSSRTRFEENIYLVSNRGKVTIDTRENL